MKLKVISDNCSGCRTCLLICTLANLREINPSKAALRIESQFPAPGKFKIHVCDQCGQCAEVCPVEAIYLENGVYKINEDECIGCMNCVSVCPHGVMVQHNQSETPIKCTLCGECVIVCPRDALILEENQQEGVKIV